MKRLEYTTESGISTRIAPPLMQDAGEARMHKSLLNIGIAAVLVLLLVCCGAAAAEADETVLIKYDSVDLTVANIINGLNSPFYGNATLENKGEGFYVIKLSENAIINLEYSLESQLGVATDNTPKLTLDLNGGVIQRKPILDDRKFSLITIGSGMGLNLIDNSNDNNVHYFEVKESGPWVLNDTKTSGTPLESITKASELIPGTTVIKVTGGVITGGSVTDGNGGGVYVNGGTFTMNGGNIVGNSATGINGNGGGVYVDGGTFTMSGGSITGNSAKEGGGVYVDGGTFTMSGGSITGNTANSGCGVCVKNSGSMFTMSGTAKITGNKATNNGKGGGVYVYNNGEFIMSCGSITGNSVSGNGGGVYFSSTKTFIMSGGTISKNSAKEGGGVYNFGGTFTMSSIVSTASITGNTAEQNGGGVYVYFGTFEMEGGEIKGNEATDGGGVYITSVNGYIGALIMSGGSITKNTAVNGGGVYVTGISDTKKGTFTGTFTMSSGSITGNTATGTAEQNGGGGVYVAQYGVFTMEGGTIGGTDDGEGNTAKYGGGGVFNGGTFEMSGGSITGNTATQNGGGVWSGVTFTMTGGTIGSTDGNGNTAKDGGGVYVNSGTFTMSGDAYIIGNTATGTVAYSGGGGVYVAGGTFTMSGDANITGNKATGTIGSQIFTVGGGGVFVSGGKFTMENGIIQGNTVNGNGHHSGGGVFIIDTSSVSGVFEMKDGCIIGNSADHDGGGVYVTTITKGTFDTHHGTFKMSGGTIGGLHDGEKNTASNIGGGVCAWSGEFEMTGTAVVEGNTATNGGGVYVNADACVFNMSGGKITKNTANNGGGVYVTGNWKPFTMSSGNITENKATQDGGGVWDGGTFNVMETPIIKNNKKGTDLNNVYLPSGKAITITSALESGAKIWVTTETDPSETTQVAVTGTNTDDYSANFESDKAAYYVANTGTESSQVVKLFVGKKVTYNGNGNTGGDVPVDSKSYKPGAEVTVLGNTGSLAKTGYTFGGWNTQQDGTGDNYVADAKFTIAEDTYLYANWTVSTYNIIYKDKGGADFSGTHESGYPKTHIYETETPLKTATKTGYTFGGWFKESDCSGTAVTSLGAEEYTADILLYADWTANKTIVTLDAQEGTGGTASVEVTYDAEMPTEGVTMPTKTGYTFTGYFDAETSGNQYYTADGSSAKNWDKTEATATLYAQWAVEEYTVTFDMKGHGTQIEEKKVKSGSLVIEPAKPTADGYTFGGWYKEAACTNLYDFSTPVTEDIILYAKWTAVITSYTIQFYGNGGTVSPSTLTVNYGESVDLSKIAATRSGYIHTGWATTSKSKSAEYTAGQKVAGLKDGTTLYAVWTPESNLRSLTVEVKMDSTLVDAAVKLKQGENQFITPTKQSTGTYIFSGVPEGAYTLVTEYGTGEEMKTVTKSVMITKGENKKTVTIPSGDVNSKIDIKPGTRTVSVDGVDDLANREAITEKIVTVTVVVETKKDGSAPDVQSQIDKIKEEAKKSSSDSKLEYLGITIEKKVNDAFEKYINSTTNVLEFIIPYDFTNKKDVKLYRFHEGAGVTPLEKLSEKPSAVGTKEGYWLDMDNGMIYIYAKEFSVYSVSYVPDDSPQPTPSPSSSRSSGASVWLPAASPDTEGAQITHTITAQYAGHTFIGAATGDIASLRTVNPEIAAAAEIKIAAAEAAGIKVTNIKGAPALILTSAAEGLDTVTFSEVYDIKPSNPNEKLTQVTVTVPKADIAASGLTTDDVTIYHFLDVYDLWVPLDTLQITEDEANYYYTAATDGASPFGVLIKRFDVASGEPVETPASPAPLAAVLAGLGAALVFGLRRK